MILAEISIGDAATWTGAISAILALVGGGAWWMSSLHGKVGGIDVKVDTLIADQKANHNSIWAAITVQKDQHHHLDIRVTRLEERSA